MLMGEHRARAMRLLQLSSLLARIMPELAVLEPADEPEAAQGDRQLTSLTRPVTPWQHTLAVLSALDPPTFSAALAVLARGLELGKVEFERKVLFGQEVLVGHREGLPETGMAGAHDHEQVRRRAGRLEHRRDSRSVARDAAGTRRGVRRTRTRTGARSG